MYLNWMIVNFNARVCCDHDTQTGVYIIGRHGPKEKNDNGEYLLDVLHLTTL